MGYLASRDERYAQTPVRQAFDTFANPPEFELYDLETDPWEFRNIAGDPEHVEALQRMQAALEEWRRETADPLLDPAFSDEMRQRVDSYYQRRLNAAARGLQQPTAVN